MIWKITDNKNWDYLSKTFTWVEDMQHVPQDIRYHAEGNVAKHTQLVIRHLEESSYFQSLGEQEKEIIWTAALMHDIEKRSTTVTEPDGSVTAHWHARRGEYTARELLFRDIPTPFYIREQIASLVRYHGLPLWLMERPNLEKRLYEASIRTDTKMLKSLAEADVNGRICDDQEKLRQQVAFFEEFCIEQDCWGKARLFNSDHARFYYFNNEDTYAGYVPYDHFKSEVLLLSGMPGMGKDHFIKSSGPDWPVISLDDIRRKHKLSPLDKSATGWVVQEAKNQARVYLRQGNNFIWNATNITRQMRQQLIDLFTTYQAKVKIVYIEKPYKTWIDQNKNREYVIPQSALDKMLHKLEIPNVYEAHEVEYFIS